MTRISMAGVALALTFAWGQPPMPPTTPLATGGAPLVAEDDGRSPYARAEALLLWTKGDTGTHVGGRAAAGAWLSEAFGVEVGGFVLEQRSAPVADFGPFDAAEFTQRLYGAEGTARVALVRDGALRIDALGGVRFLALDESVRGDDGGPIDGAASFNRYYLVQFGAEAEYRADALFLRGYTKLGLGLADQTVKPLGDPNPFGLAATQQSRFAFAPEVGVTFGCEVAPGLSVTAGYSLLFLNSAARPFGGADDFHAHGLNFGLQWRY